MIKTEQPKERKDRVVAHVCGVPLSRYRCRATRVAADLLRILGFKCSSGIALHPPPP